MRKLLLLTASLSILGMSCRKGFLDINHNPNNATSSKPELVLSNALVSTAAEVDNPLGNFFFISGWMGYIAQNSGYILSSNDFQTYRQTNSFGENVWQSQYHNIADYDYVAKSAKASGQGYYQGVGLIMRSLNYQILVDLFNNVPYSEALLGTDNIRPKYDDASTIYGDLFLKIDSAMALIKVAADAPDPTADLMFARKYSENPLSAAHFEIVRKQWLQFANTVKLRMLERLSEMATKPNYFTTELNKVASDPNGFLTIDATVNPGYLSTAGKQSPFYGSNFPTGAAANNYFVANAFPIAFYNAHSDPRLTQVYSPVSGGGIQGNVLGNPTGPGSNFGPGVLSSTSQDAVIMLASESYFIQAEAAARGWISGDPTTLYQSGVTESFRYLSVPNYSSVASTYFNRAGDTATNMATRTTMGQKINLIIMQKWIAENLINVLEPYDDYRRFFNSNLTLPRPLSFITNSGPPYAINQTTTPDVRAIPFRILYPQTELNTNAANVPSPIDHHTSKIFWMP